MSRFLSFVVLLAGPAILLVGQDATTKSADQPRLVRLTVHPAGEPVSALRYELLPYLLDQTPGNAATFYLTACLLVTDDVSEVVSKNYHAWTELAPKAMPSQEIRDAVNKFQSALGQVELAALREECDWNLPIRSEGFRMLLPSMAKLRTLARALSLRIRLSIAEGDTDAALRDLRVGLALARHAADGPTIIQQLVGIAIADIMVDRVEELLGNEDCPNLYWALAQLPAPLISLRKGLRYEKQGLFFHYPQLRDPRNARFSGEEWKRLAVEAVEFFGSLTKNSQSDSTQGVEEVLAEFYPPARQYLLAEGYTAKQIEAMPREQVIAIHQVDRFLYWRDEIFKWFDVPYWQGWKGLQDAEQALEKDGKEAQGDARTLAAVLLPSLGKATTYSVQLDRRIAGLRCIEAIRLYATKHDGKVPASLDDIAEVPIPLDPVTGKPFQYKREQNVAILQWDRPPLQTQAKYAARYELTIVP